MWFRDKKLLLGYIVSVSLRSFFGKVGLGT